MVWTIEFHPISPAKALLPLADEAMKNIRCGRGYRSFEIARNRNSFLKANGLLCVLPINVTARWCHYFWRQNHRLGVVNFCPPVLKLQ